MATTTQTSTAAAALTLAGTQAPTSTPIIWGFGGKPSIDKGKNPDPLAVVGDLAALRVEDSQAGVFQEEEHQDPELQEELQEQEEETQN